jgi:hypothetical protein
LRIKKNREEVLTETGVMQIGAAIFGLADLAVAVSSASALPGQTQGFWRACP